MPRPLSLDLRERIVEAVEAGSSRREAAERFEVSVSCAIKLLQRWERTGSVAPAPMGGRKPHALAAHEARVRAVLPKDLPPKSTAHYYFMLWDWDGTLERRETIRRNREFSFGISESLNSRHQRTAALVCS